MTKPLTDDPCLKEYAGDGAYKGQIDRYTQMVTDSDVMERMGTEAAVLALVFVRAATAPKPKRRCVKGFGVRPMMFIRKWFGDWVYEWILKRAFG